MIPESELTPASGVPKLVDVEAPPADAQLLAKTVVLKLNGGLGTSMGLDYAKSLLKVKGADTFLDLTAKQIMQMRDDLQTNVKFVLMNSFATSADTMAFFKEKYPALYADPNLEFVQNKVDLGVPRCCGAFTPSTRLVSRIDGSGWFLFRF